MKLTDAQIAAAGIELLTAGPRELRDMLHSNGTVQPNQEALVKVTPRFPGVIRSMRKRLGDKVKKDEVLATVESNQSLTVYELQAPIPSRTDASSSWRPSRSVRSARGASRACRSMRFPPSPTSRCRSTPWRRATRRSRSSSASPSRWKRRWAACPSSNIRSRSRATASAR